MAYSLKEINDAVRSDPKGFVEECDAAYARKIESAARRIADNRSRSRIVLLSGPCIFCIRFFLFLRHGSLKFGPVLPLYLNRQKVNQKRNQNIIA